MPAPTVKGMSGQGDRWTAEQVLGLAPDAASGRAGRKLASPAPWSETGAGAGAVWGLCKGSGSKPYQTVVDLEDGSGSGNGPAYTCSCPSRKHPCKHALGLLLLWAADAEKAADATGQGGGRNVPEAPVPATWAEPWLTGRRERAGRAGAGADRAARGAGTEKGPVGSGGSAGGGAAEAARRRADRRAARMAAGAADLEERLADLLRGGLAGADRRGYAEWEEMAARMVDAQAPGLAARVRELGAMPSSGRDSGGRPDRILSELSLLHLLDQGLLGVDGLPEQLSATVRARAGVTVEAAELLADAEARIRDAWLVLAQRDTAEGRMAVRRVWLHGRRTGRPALLLSFGVAGRAPTLSLPVGALLDAELAFHPGASRLRAVLGERHGREDGPFVPAGGTVTEALGAYAKALCADPWLESWPVVLRDVVPIPPAGPPDDEGGWQVADAEGEAALPVTTDTAASGLWDLLAVSGGGPVTVFGECGHRGFAPYATWAEGELVAL